MYVVFIILAVVLILPGIFLVIMFGGTTQMLGLALVGVSGFLGVLARIDQASVHHKELMKAVNHRASPTTSAPRTARPKEALSAH